MAQAIAEGVNAAGGTAQLFEDPSGFSKEQLAGYDIVAFGCPAMGTEVLEEELFDPMFTGLEPELKGRKIALFGSYGWGDGQWMRDWCQRSQDAGAVLHSPEGLIINEQPDSAGLDTCRDLGRQLAGW